MINEIKNACLKAFESGEVGYFIGWQATRFADKTTPLFMRSAEDVEKLVWNKYCVNSTAKYALEDKYPEKKIGIILRGCDSRAVARMISDKQLKRENLYLIGVVCDGKEDPICATCSHKTPVIYDVLIGQPTTEEISPERFAEVEKIAAMTPDERYNYWAVQYDKCIRCYACRNVCPACNCVECYADQYRTGWQGKAHNRAENQVYGLTRAYHVGDRCIECGQCERVCPMNLPIMSQTRKMLKDINDLFGPTECGLTIEEAPVLGEYDLNDREEFM